MGKSKSMGKWERRAYEWAQNLNTSERTSEWRGGHNYGRSAQWCFCVKVYDVPAVSSGAVEKALKDKYVLDDAQATEFIESCQEDLSRDCWDSMDESVRFHLFGDESGWGAPRDKRKAHSGGRSGGWLLIDWEPLKQDERDLTRDERRKLTKAMRGIGGSIDYALSVEAFMQQAEYEEWETREHAANERERSAFAELTPCGAD